MSVARLIAPFVLVLGGVWIGGCCRTDGEPVVDVCSKPNVKCKLNGGQLGICVRAEAKPSPQCTREPCPIELVTAPYTCAPQH